jgi:hypothetical protein
VNAIAISLRCGCDELMFEHFATCERSHPVRDADAESLSRIQWVAARVRYRDWAVRVKGREGMILMQVCTTMPDVVSGDLIENNGRPVLLCPAMSDGFLVDLAFGLVREIELHESAEKFMVDNSRIYYPHESSGRPLQEVAAMRFAPHGLDSQLRSG